MNDCRINERISAYRVIVITSDGQNKGEILKTFAIEMAKQEGLDLVQVSNANPPVCKIMDYGKMLYMQKKAEKHNTHAPTTKEIRFKYKTEAHDLEIKKRKADDFLKEGHRVVVSMILKGREKFVTGDAARERFSSLVKEFFSSYKVGDIKENKDNFSVVISP